MASSSPRRRIVIVSVSAVITLGVLQLFGGVASGLRTIGSSVVAPFTWALDQVARPIGHAFSGALNYSEVVAQNARLRTALGEAQLHNNEDSGLRLQLRELTSTLHVPYVGGLSTIVAGVTDMPRTQFVASITIGKGRSDGVLVNMPVVANGGLIGRVASTTLTSATVRLITDVGSLVGCTFGNGRVDALVRGGGLNHPLSVNAITMSANLTPGTVFSTNGLQGGLFPPGLPVARVQSVSLTPGNSTYDVRLRALADMTHLSYVSVVVWEPGT